MKTTSAKFFCFFLTILLISNCAGSRDTRNMSMEERLQYARKLFDDEDYFDAKTQFQILVLNNPGSRIIDMAQFYLAESYFNNEEYITAAAEYEKLINLYPNSEYRDHAQYKLGKCYYHLSPQSQLDQKYTHRAIELYQIFLDENPNSEFADEVMAELEELRTKLAKKEFETGEQYRKREIYVSALISFDEVLARYYDTKYAEPALFWKAHSHYELGELKQARDSLQILFDKYPKTSFRDDARELGRKIDTELQQSSKTAENANNQGSF